MSVGGVHIELVSVEDAWARLKSDAGSVLIDVRTGAEWTSVGFPDLSSIGKKPLLIEWQTYPDGQVNAQFVDRANKALAALGASRTTELFFICRSGARSHRAAEAMAAAGYSRCCNVAGGFE